MITFAITPLTSLLYIVYVEKQFKKVLAAIQTGIYEGAHILLGGNRIGTKGRFVEPTVFIDVKPKSSLAREEVTLCQILKD